MGLSGSGSLSAAARPHQMRGESRTKGPRPRDRPNKGDRVGGASDMIKPCSSTSTPTHAESGTLGSAPECKSASEITAPVRATSTERNAVTVRDPRAETPTRTPDRPDSAPHAPPTVNRCSNDDAASTSYVINPFPSYSINDPPPDVILQQPVHRLSALVPRARRRLDQTLGHT